MFEQAFKNIDDILHKDAGCGSELDYVEQTSWMLFLKYLEDLERDKQTAASLAGKTYQPIIEEAYKWHKWSERGRIVEQLWIRYGPQTLNGEYPRNKPNVLAIRSSVFFIKSTA